MIHKRKLGLMKGMNALKFFYWSFSLGKGLKSEYEDEIRALKRDKERKLEEHLKEKEIIGQRLSYITKVLRFL
jgi:hypothetical protein